MTRHFRDDIELPELNRDDYYSHHYQEIRSLRRRPKVLPGDALVTTCYYDTRGYTNTTLGGFSISDEMCVRFIFMSDILHPTEYGNNLTLYYIQVCELHQYFPATNLEVCKSSVSEKTLVEYFDYMQEYDTRYKTFGFYTPTFISIFFNQAGASRRCENRWTAFGELSVDRLD